MAYIGSTPESQNFISGTDYFNGTGSQTAFTLTRTVNSVNDVEVVVNNVIQQPNSYTVSGTTLTLSAAPSSGTSNVYVRYLSTNQRSFTVGNNTVGYNQLTTEMQSKFAMKNRIINGAMIISQRNGTSSTTPTTSGTYNLDRWKTILTQASKFSIQQNAGSVTPPDGFINYAGITSLSAYSVTSTDIFSFAQAVEGLNVTDLGWGTANAKPVTISFWVRSSLTGTFSVTVSNASQARSYPATYTVSSANTWEQKTITVAGDTSGTWLTTNGIGIWLFFNLGSGSTFSATANAWGAGEIYAATGATSVVGTSGATFYITGVQLEVGTSATGFEYRQYGQELQLCQRYYKKVSSSIGQTISANSSTGIGIPLGTTMRTQPTLDSGSSFVVNAGSAGSPIVYSGTGSGTDGNTIYIYNNSNNWNVGITLSLNAGFNAEL